MVVDSTEAEAGGFDQSDVASLPVDRSGNVGVSTIWAFATFFVSPSESTIIKSTAKNKTANIRKLSLKIPFIKVNIMNKKQDEYKVKVDSKYSKYIKLAIAILTAFGLIGTGAHQAGFFDIEAEPTFAM
jgi:hypothetical protein